MVAFDMLDAYYDMFLTSIWGDKAGASGSPPHLMVCPGGVSALREQ